MWFSGAGLKGGKFLSTNSISSQKMVLLTCLLRNCRDSSVHPQMWEKHLLNIACVLLLLNYNPEFWRKRSFVKELTCFSAMQKKKQLKRGLRLMLNWHWTIPQSPAEMNTLPSPIKISVTQGTWETPEDNSFKEGLTQKTEKHGHEFFLWKWTCRIKGRIHNQNLEISSSLKHILQ